MTATSGGHGALAARPRESLWRGALPRVERLTTPSIATTGVSSSSWRGPGTDVPRVTVPATALARAIHRPERQVRLARLIRQATTDVRSLDRVDATAVGRLLASSGTSDVADAHVVICARRAEQRVATSDADDIRRLDPGIALIAL